jgi:hypothetical protein
MRIIRSVLLTASVAVACEDEPISTATGPDTSVQAEAVESFYAAPTGTSTGDGSITRPWDLTTALKKTSVVGAGDTLWLRGGTYRGSFNSYLSGTADAPVVIRNYSSERATIDGGTATSNPLRTRGPYAWYWGLEVTDSRTSYSGKSNGIYALAADVRFINMVVHDTRVGVTLSNESPQNEFYGGVIYNNSSHAIYAKHASTLAPKVLRDNVAFNNSSYGLHVYTDSGSGSLVNLEITGNILFNTSGISLEGKANLLVGGREPADDIVVRDNVLWKSSWISGINAQLGYSTSTPNGDLVLERNRISGGSTALRLTAWSRVTAHENHVAGTSTLLSVYGASGYTWTATSLFRAGTSASVYALDGRAYTLSGWLSRTGFPAGAFAERTGWPPATEIIVRPNRYEPGRANVAVLNWQKLSSVQVDLTGILTVGQGYVVKAASDFYGPPVASGTYEGGAITIPMAPVTPAAPIWTSRRARATEPEFGAFVVLPR